MFQIGDYIVYDNKGVCKVLDNHVTEFDGTRTSRTYYKLSLIYQGGLIYIPTTTTVFMRPVISSEEAKKLIRRLPVIQEVVITYKIMPYLEKQYDELLGTHDCETLFQVIKGLYLKKQRKNLGQIEQSYMKRAEDILYGELAVSLGIPRESVVSYIEETVSKIKTSKK